MVFEPLLLVHILDNLANEQQQKLYIFLFFISQFSIFLNLIRKVFVVQKIFHKNVIDFT